MIFEAPAGLKTDVPADVYHADRQSVSKSMLWDFRQRRRLFEGRYLLGTAPAKAKTTAMDLGSVADAALLEPDRLGDLCVVIPRDLLDVRGYETTAAAKAFRQQHEAAGRIVLTEREFDTVAAMVMSVQDTLSDWLKLPSKRQASIWWTEPETGIRCRCRPDWLFDSAGTAFIFDVKTTADSSPRAFRYRCEEHGYWLQHVHYSEGVAAATGKDTEFFFVVVETAWPFTCCVQRLSRQQLCRAEAARLGLLRDLRACLESGDFREPWEARVETIDLNPRCFDLVT